PGLRLPISPEALWKAARNPIALVCEGFGFMTGREGEPRQRESRRILERVRMEARGNGAVARAARRVRDHVSAADSDKDDWAEYWGTRIGGILGLVVTIFLLGWLVLYLIGVG